MPRDRQVAAAYIDGTGWRKFRRDQQALRTVMTDAAPAPGETHLDLKGLKCPLPALKARKALSRMGAGEILVIACTDPMAAIDIPHLANQTGDRLEGQERNDGVLVFRIRKV
jgi:tRNA 2-thiouridine synthesizing protein A